MWSNEEEKQLLEAENKAKIKVIAETEQVIKDMQELYDLTALWKKELKYVGLEIKKIFINQKGDKKQWVSGHHSAGSQEQSPQSMQQTNQPAQQNTTRNCRLTGKEKEQKMRTNGKAKTWTQLDLTGL